MSHADKVEATKELAEAIKKAGYRVFIAQTGTYGFYTDATGSRVVSFQYDLGGFKFAGNYKTDQPRQTGTGWGMGETWEWTATGFRTMFSSGPPSEFLRGAKWKFTTLDQHLATYQASSRYVELEGQEP